MSIKQVIGEASPQRPYSRAVKVGNLVFVSGHASIDIETGKVVNGDIKVQTRQTIENIKSALEKFGLTLENVVKVTVFLKDMKYYEEMNEVYYSYFKQSPPARTCVKAGLAKDELLVEMEAIAVT